MPPLMCKSWGYICVNTTSSCTASKKSLGHIAAKLMKTLPVEYEETREVKSGCFLLSPQLPQYNNSLFCLLKNITNASLYEQLTSRYRSSLSFDLKKKYMEMQSNPFRVYIQRFCTFQYILVGPLPVSFEAIWRDVIGLLSCAPNTW